MEKMEFTRIDKLGADLRGRVKEFPVAERRPLSEAWDYIPVCRWVEKPTRKIGEDTLPGILLEEFIYVEFPDGMGIAKLHVVPKDAPDVPGALDLPGQTVARAIEGIYLWKRRNPFLIRSVIPTERKNEILSL